MKHPDAETTIHVPDEYKPLIEDLRELTTDGDNPNYMSKRIKEGLWKSLQKLGWIYPILVDMDGLMGDGEQRLTVCLDHKEYYAPVLRLDVDDVDRRLLRQITDKVEGTHNKDRDLLEFKRIIDGGRRKELISILQLKEKDIKDALAGYIKEDTYQLPALDSVVTDIELGDIYEIGSHRVLCGDSTKPDTFTNLLGVVKANMVMTDPPYNVDYSEKTKFMNKMDSQPIRDQIANDKIEDTQGFLFDWLVAMKPYLTDYNTVYITFAETNLKHLLIALDVAEYYHSQTIIWNKNSIVFGRSDYKYKHEPIVYCWSGKHKFYGKNESSVWDIKRPSQSKLHPTMKPVELCARAIGNSSLPGDIVLDAFAGSGSTLIACEQLDRKGYMIELDPRYCQIILDRFEAYTGEKGSRLEGVSE